MTDSVEPSYAKTAWETSHVPRATVYQRLSAQHAVARIVADAEDLQRAAPRILQAICECLDWDIGMLWVVDRSLNRIRCADAWITPGVQAPEFLACSRALLAEAGQSLPGHAWRLGRPVWVADLPHGGPVFVRGDAAARDGLHGAVAFPIMLRDEVLGVMDFLSHEVRVPDADVLEMLTTFGSQIGQFIERKRAEEDLHSLAVQLSEAADVERRRVARDIHDSIGQTLSALKMELARRHDAALAPALELVNHIIAQTRSLTFDLYPAMLDDLGLVPTLESFAEQWSARHCVLASVSELGERHVLPLPVTNYLFRAIKELLSNVAKHARATQTLVVVHWQPAGLRVSVADDGVGFDPQRALLPQHRRGLGLADMRERVRFLGGRMWIDSAKSSGAAERTARGGAGTQIVLELPIAPTTQPERHG